MDQSEFSLNQKVVYPSQGLGVVTEIFQKEFKGENTNYYKIYIPSSEMNVMVPVVNAKALGIRAVVSREEAQAALDSIDKDVSAPVSDWKERFKKNLELLKKGTIFDITAIVRSLYQRSKVKELPVQERRLYENARTLLIEEIAEAFGCTTEEVEELLLQKLELLPAAERKGPVVASEDDEYTAEEEAIKEPDESEGEDESGE